MKQSPCICIIIIIIVRFILNSRNYEGLFYILNVKLLFMCHSYSLVHCYCDYLIILHHFIFGLINVIFFYPTSNVYFPQIQYLIPTEYFCYHFQSLVISIWSMMDGYILFECIYFQRQYFIHIDDVILPPPPPPPPVRFTTVWGYLINNSLFLF